MLLLEAKGLAEEGLWSLFSLRVGLGLTRAVDGPERFSANDGKMVHQEAAHQVVSVLILQNLEVSFVVSVLECFLDLEGDLYFLGGDERVIESLAVQPHHQLLIERPLNIHGDDDGISDDFWLVGRDEGISAFVLLQFHMGLLVDLHQLGEYLGDGL